MKKLLLLFPMLLILLGVDTVYANNQFDTDANGGAGTVLTVKPDQDSGWPGPYGIRITLVNGTTGARIFNSVTNTNTVSVDYTNFTGLEKYKHFGKQSKIERGTTLLTASNFSSLAYSFKKMDIPIPKFISDEGKSLNLIEPFFLNNFNPTNNLSRLVNLLKDLNAPQAYIDAITQTYKCQKEKDDAAIMGLSTPSCNSSTATITGYNFHLLVEPIGYVYLKPENYHNLTGRTIWIAGTASELALFMSPSNGSYNQSGWVAGFTHNNLPKSIYIKNSYYGKLSGIAALPSSTTRLSSPTIYGSSGYGVGVVRLSDLFPPVVEVAPTLDPAACGELGEFRDFNNWKTISENTTSPSLKVDVPNTANFCKVYCRQEVSTRFPGEVLNVKAGTHLPLQETVVGGSKECRAYIDVPAWKAAYDAANAEVVRTFNIWVARKRAIADWEAKYGTSVTSVTGCFTSTGIERDKVLSCSTKELVSGRDMRNSVSYYHGASYVTTFMPEEKTHANFTVSPFTGTPISLAKESGVVLGTSYKLWESLGTMSLTYNLCTVGSNCPSTTNGSYEILKNQSCVLTTTDGYIVGSNAFNQKKISADPLDPRTYSYYIRGKYFIDPRGDEDYRVIFAGIFTTATRPRGTGIYFYQTFRPREVCPSGTSERTISKPTLGRTWQDYLIAVQALETVIGQLKTCNDGWSATFTQKPELVLDFTETASNKTQTYNLVPTTTDGPLIENKVCNSSYSLCLQKTAGTLRVNKNVCNSTTWTCSTQNITNTAVAPYLFSNIMRSQSQRIDYSLPTDANRYVDKATGISHTWATLPARVKTNKSYVDIGYANIPISYGSDVNNPAGEIRVRYKKLGEQIGSTGKSYFDSMLPAANFDANGYLRYSCPWTPMKTPSNECQGFCFTYRPIDLKSPFPGYNSVEREPGANWTTDPDAIRNNITFNRGVADEAVYTNRTPMFRIDFTGANRTAIQAIRAYNKANNYDYTELVCNGVDGRGNNAGTQCRSVFLRSKTMLNSSGKSILSGCGTSTNWTNCPGTE
jgi:hypothetical protein